MTAEEAYRANRVLLAERMGWTLEYWDNLDEMDRWDVLQVLEAKDKAHAHDRARQQRAAERRSR